MTVSNPFRTAPTPPDDDDRYEDWLAAVRAHFASTVAASPHLFTTDAAGLWEAYLDAAPPGERQVWTCATCRAFVERFGALTTIRADGSMASALWPDAAPPAYADAARALASRVAKANVTGVFCASAAMWGVPAKGGWTHFSIEPPASLRWSSLVTTAAQAMAEKKEEHVMLLRGMDEFPLPVVQKAFTLLTNGALFRSEKCEGVARWLLDLHERRAAAKSARVRDHLTWLAVAGAPAGHCHVRSGMIGTLLEDLQGGELSFDEVKGRFDAKMHPLQYLRPQAAPAAGNIAQAEKIVAALGTAGALARRFAKLADVEALWTPRPPADAKPARSGVFAHLTPRGSEPTTTSPAPPTVMTWVKFAATVLPTAEAIELLVPTGLQPFMAMVTATNADAPPIVQWDRAEKRNPVSMFTYVNGTEAARWNLRAGEHRRVTAIVLRPWMWDEARPFAHHGAGLCVVLEGARDLAYDKSGGLFPEWLKSEYHGVRATLEAHFRSAVIAGKDEAEVCGLSLNKGATASFILRVTARGMRASYTIDRWD
jgi:hypothetical protein